jgi:hypothetical protein
MSEIAPGYRAQAEQLPQNEVAARSPERTYSFTPEQFEQLQVKHAQSQLFLYRVEESILNGVEGSHDVPRFDSIQPLQQYQEKRGIHSCTNTTQLNGMLWQGQISQADAEKVHESFGEMLRPYFGQLIRSQIDRNFHFQPGLPSLAERYPRVAPEADFSYFDVDIKGRAVMPVLLSELSRRSVVAAEKPEHTVLVVGYDNYSPDNPLATMFKVVDPAQPSRFTLEPAAAFSKVSMVFPALADPVRMFANSHVYIDEAVAKSAK